MIDGSVVVLAGPTNGTGQGFGNLAYLVVVGIVLAGAAKFAVGLSFFVVVIANAIFTSIFRRLSKLLVVLADATTVARGFPNCLVVVSSDHNSHTFCYFCSFGFKR